VSRSAGAPHLTRANKKGLPDFQEGPCDDNTP
jgi:hypothetical protein